MASSSSNNPENENARYESCTDSVAYDIFISFAGAQEEFARRLYETLEPRYSVFPISKHVFPVPQDASKTCRLALLVLSREFLCSPQCVLELCTFIDAMSSGLKVVPLYLGLDVDLERFAHSAGRISVSKCDEALEILRSLRGLHFEPSMGELDFLEQITSSISEHQLLNSSYALSPMYDIYLSYAFKQQGFVKGLYKMLSPLYTTFSGFNMPLGISFAMSAFKAASNCKLALLVVSHDFPSTKWNMRELLWFLKQSPSVKVIPIFYKLRSDDIKPLLKPILRRALKFNEVDLEPSECADAMRMLFSISGLFVHPHEGELTALNNIVSTIYGVLPVTNKIQDLGHLQGMDRMCNIIFHKLKELESKQLLRNPTPPPQSKVCVLGMYGLMGTGKSTLSRHLCSHFFSQFKGKVLYMELPMNCTPAELAAEFMGLFYLTNHFNHNIDLDGVSDLSQLYVLLKKANLRNSRIFLVIDNIASEESVKLVETILQLGIGSGSKVILVSRSLDILRPLLSCKYEGHYYVCDSILVPSLDEREAFQVLLQGGAGMAVKGYHELEAYLTKHKEVLGNVLRMCDFGSHHQCLQLYNPLLLKSMGSLGKMYEIVDVEKCGRELQNFVAKAELREKEIRANFGESLRRSSSAKSVCGMQPESSSLSPAEEGGLPIPVHEIFLSHSGKQKGFAKDLYEKLSSLYTTFFDIKHHSLPPTEKFPPHILSAARKCRLAVVVLSEDFVHSRWPMIELCTFVDAMRSVKILPVFYGLTPNDLDNEDCKKQWHTKWEQLAQNNSNHPIDTSKWSSALRTVKSITGPIFKPMEGQVAYLDEIMCCISDVVPPAIKYDDRLIYGKDRLLKIILNKLENMVPPQSTKVCVLGLYGLQGSGKSTLSKCLRDHFFSQFSGRSLYLELPTNPSLADLCSKFKELLQLTKFNNMVNPDKVSDLLQVYKLLETNNLSSFKVCLVVDNLSSPQSVQAITRVLNVAGVGPGSKVILVARSLKVLEPALRLQERYICDSISIPSIDETEAIQILLERTGAGVGYSGNTMEKVLTSKQRKIVEGVVRMCGFGSDSNCCVYLPLVMETMGTLLFENHNDVERWGSELESFWARSLKNYKENAVRSLVGESFKALSKQLQLLFLDVVLFVLPFHDGKSINIDDASNLLKVKHESSSDTIKMKIRDLEKLSFVTISSETGMISVHDVHLEFAKSIQQQPLDS